MARRPPVLPLRKTGMSQSFIPCYFPVFKNKLMKKFFKISINFKKKTFAENLKNRACFRVFGGFAGPYFVGGRKGTSVPQDISMKLSPIKIGCVELKLWFSINTYLDDIGIGEGGVGGSGGGRDIVQYTDVKQQNRHHHCVSHHRKPYKTILMRL